MSLIGLQPKIGALPEELHVHWERSKIDGGMMWFGGYVFDPHEFGPFPRLIDVIDAALEKERERH